MCLCAVYNFITISDHISCQLYSLLCLISRAFQFWHNFFLFYLFAHSHGAVNSLIISSLYTRCFLVFPMNLKEEPFFVMINFDLEFLWSFNQFWCVVFHLIEKWNLINQFELSVCLFSNKHQSSPSRTFEKFKLIINFIDHASHMGQFNLTIKFQLIKISCR